LYTGSGEWTKARRVPGNSLDELRAFPVDARRAAGHQIDRVQRGQEPDDWKPLSSVGRGVQEIRLWDVAGTFRVVYVARFAEMGK
jgi:phage-related protein